MCEHLLGEIVYGGKYLRNTLYGKIQEITQVCILWLAILWHSDKANFFLTH